MKPEVTLGTVFCNGVHAIELMWRSYYAHNKDIPVQFWGWDNASTDGAMEYVYSRSNRLFKRPPRTSHQQGADGLCRECDTDFMLLVDFDVEFLAPFTAEALQLLKGDPSALCVAYPSGEPNVQFPVGKFGLMNGTKRINPCCVLFRTAHIKRLLEHFTFGTYFHFGEPRIFFEVGAMIRQVAEVSGMTIIEPEWVPKAVKHYGQIGALVANHELTPELRTTLLCRYNKIASKAELYEEPPETFGNP